MRQRLIVVLGMHRSGTSTMTRALQTMGVELGSRLMPPVEGVNDKGFWEDLDLCELNIEMLGALNRDWHYLAPVGEDFVDVLCGKGFLSRAEELLRQKVGQSPVFGFKDPRVAMLLPFWQRVFALCDIDVSYVLALRNPVSVAESLARREHFEFHKSTLLWLGHVLSMMRGTMGANRRVLVDYDRLVQAPGSELQRMADRLNLVLDPLELQTYERDFLSVELRHSVHVAEDLSAGDFAMPVVIELYPLLQSAASDTLDIDAPVLTRRVNDASAEFARDRYYLSQMDAMYQQSQSAHQGVSERDEKISALRRAIEQAREETREATPILREREAFFGVYNKSAANRGHGTGGRSIAGVASSSKFPVAFLFEYSATASPASIGESLDDRELAVGFTFLRLRETASGREICTIDFANIDSTRSLLLFGFQQPEPWGMWSAGMKSCIVVWRETELLDEIHLSLDAFPYSGASPEMKCTFSSSAGHRQELVLRGDARPLEIVVAVEGKAKAMPFCGARSLLAGPNNVSRAQDMPLVSIIILNFNKPELTLLSAMSVLAASISVTFEILLVDNGSTTECFELLRAHDLPVRLVRNAANRYFGEGNNLGAEVARGEYLLFLNNDAFLAPHCVDALLQAFHEVPNCGAAGPVFCYPDGTLQEAGAFIGLDGGSLRRGNKRRDFDLASLPNFDVVDYVSAACIMIRADRFADVGGFSYRYDPAYYEDVELCFRLKLRGECVVLAKSAVCFHIGNATARDEMGDSDIEATINVNRPSLLLNWGAYLQRRTSESLPSKVIPRRRIRVARQMDEITQATFMPFPLVPSGAVRQALATTIALRELGPAALTTAEPYSSMRLEGVTFDLGLSLGRIKGLPLAMVVQKKLERIFVMGRGICPVYVPLARRSFFHCRSPFSPVALEGGSQQHALDVLPLFEKVLVSSEFAKRGYETELRRLGVTIPVDVLPPAVTSERLLKQVRNDKPWILSVGGFSESGSNRRQDVLIDAMKRTSASFREGWTLILCGGVPNSIQDRVHFRSLQESVGNDIRVRFVLSPPRAMLDELLSECSVYADARGFGARESGQYWKCESFGASLVEALVAGCRTICYEVGGGPEILERAQSGATYGSVEELAALLDQSQVSGLPFAIREKVSAQFSDRQFTDRILAAVY
jgi:GT2 family glycosyltransferase/glycosyltransferase involved in cell wall biosynthesis